MTLGAMERICLMGEAQQESAAVIHQLLIAQKVRAKVKAKVRVRVSPKASKKKREITTAYLKLSWVQVSCNRNNKF